MSLKILIIGGVIIVGLIVLGLSIWAIYKFFDRE